MAGESGPAGTPRGQCNLKNIIEMSIIKTEESVEQYINGVITGRTDLERYINWMIVTDNSQKELVKVSKSSSVNEYLSKMKDSVIITVNEDLFDLMQPDVPGADDPRGLLIENALSLVVVTTNERTGKLKIAINKPQIALSVDAHEKYGDKLVNAAICMSLAYTQLCDRRKEEKERGE